MSTERDYPFNPDADVTRLHGLARLTAIRDRDTAALLHQLYVQLEPRWRVQDSRQDFGAGGTAQFPDDYSGFDAVSIPEPNTAARATWDRKNALVFAAWQEFLGKLEEHQMDYLDRTGRELAKDQVSAHRDRFAQMMRREYGVAYADARWLDEHTAWQERR